MKSKLAHSVTTIIFLLLLLSTSYAQEVRSHKLFDDNWKFYKGDIDNGERETLNDNNWRVLDLPHDWSIEDLPEQSDSTVGPFSKASVGATSTGYVVGGTAWYRKHFKTSNTANKKVSIYFDGVYMNSDVWINGHHLGNHPYGYTSFSYDLTPYLDLNKESVLAVRVRNEGKNSRWYSGSGIYRHVWLTTTNSTFIPQWGVVITTPTVSANSAAIQIKTSVTNNQAGSLLLKTNIQDASGKTVATVQKNIASNNATDNLNIQTLQINTPHLWSPNHAYLYNCVTEVWRNGVLVDQVKNKFGVRSIEFSATKGFLLNGERTLLRGGCVHHDNGPLGSAAIDRAEERKIEILKANGYNAIRTSHNPPSQQLLDACDRLGMLVLDEAFDQWQKPKNPQDYHLYFNEWWQQDLSSMVKRDRNHPSVIIWSIGNEIQERADSSGLAIARKMRDEVYSLDSTRPITQAVCHFWDNPGYKWDTTAATFALLDVGGYNYQWQQYEPDHKKFPERIMMGTESFPKEAFDNWQLVEKHPYVIGDFVWTAMDYMGETAIGHAEIDSFKSFLKPWPWFNAYCGDIDLIGTKKPQSLYRDVVWRRQKMAMLVHAPVPEGHKEVTTPWGWPDEYNSWNFEGQQGKPIQVNVYTRYPVVRLTLNNKIIGEQTASDQTRLTATFTVNYQPGVLKAYGLKNGKVVDSIELQTTGAPKQIRLKADRKPIQANRNDLSYVTVEIMDAQGRVIPDAVLPVKFTIDGNGEIAGAGNGNPTDMASFQKPERKTFRGRCLIIVRPKGKGGKITLKAEAENLLPAEAVIITK